MVYKDLLNVPYNLQGIFMLPSSMISSMISPIAISQGEISSSMISMTTSPGLPKYCALVIGGLIIIYSLKEVLSSTNIWNKYLNSSFNLMLIPLVICFIMVVAYEAVNIIY